MAGRPPPEEALGPAAIRDAIRRIVAQRDRVRTEARRALVSYEQVRHAVAAQRLHLQTARTEIDTAIARAVAAATQARADALAAARSADLDDARAEAAADAAAAPFEQATGGLQHQRDAIDQAAAQLEAAAAEAAGEITQGRALIAAGAASLDAALREEVALLVRLERAERARVIARARGAESER